MTRTGPTDSPTVTRIERHRSVLTASISMRVNHARASYTWVPLEDRTQHAAWTRLLSFAAHVLSCIHEMPEPYNHNTPAVAGALLRWLQIAKTTPDDAVVWFITSDVDPEPLLERLVNAAAMDVTSQATESLFLRAYLLRPIAERIDLVRQLRERHPVVDDCLPRLPDWSFADDLSALHGLCAQSRAETT